MKAFKKIYAFALCALIVPTFSSCDKDDDFGTGAVIELDGTRLTSLDHSTISYDEKGRIVKVSSPNDIVIDYEKGTISENDGDEDNIMKVRFNGKGYIAELSGSWDYTETESNGDKYQYTGSGKSVFTYNSNGNLVKMETTSSETEKDFSDGTTEKFSEKTTISYIWENGNLKQAIEDNTENEDGDVDSWQYLYNVTYGSQKNIFLQMPMSLSSIAFDYDGLHILSAAGLFGKGPALIPTNLSENGDYNYSHVIYITLNDNGSIAKEEFEYNRFTYGYTTVSQPSAISAKGRNDVKLNIRNIFVRNKNHK